MPSDSLDVVNLLDAVDLGVRVVDAFYVFEDGVVVFHGCEGGIVGLLGLGVQSFDVLQLLDVLTFS